MEEKGVLNLKIANVYSLSSIVRNAKPKSETRGDSNGDENSLPRSDSTLNTVKTALHNVADDSKSPNSTAIAVGHLEIVNKDRVEYAEKCLPEGTKDSSAREIVQPLGGNIELKTDKKHLLAAKSDGKSERTLRNKNVSKAPQKKYGNSNFRRFGTELDHGKVMDSFKVSLICDEKQGKGNMNQIHSADAERESKKVSKQSASPNLYDVVKERRKASFLQRNDSNQLKKDGKRDHSINTDSDEPRCKKKKSELDKRDMLDELGCLVVLEDIEDSLAGRSRILWRHWMRRFGKCGRSCRQKYVDALYRKILRMKKSAKIRFENIDKESVYSNRNKDKTNQNFTTSGSISGDKMELDIEIKPLKVTTKVMSETKLITEGEEEKEVKIAVGNEEVTSDCKNTTVSKNTSEDIVNDILTVDTNDASSLNKITAVCKAKLKNMLVTQAQRNENLSTDSLEGRAKTESECPRASSYTSFHGLATSIPSSNASEPNTAASNAVLTNASTLNSVRTNVPPSNAFTKNIPAPSTLTTSIPISNALTTKAAVTNTPTTNGAAIKAALQSVPFILSSVNGSLVLVPVGQMTFQSPCIGGLMPLSVSYSQGHQILGNFLSSTCPTITTQQTVQYAQSNTKIDTMNKGTVRQHADNGMNVRCNDSTMQTNAANQTFPTTQLQSVVAVQNLPTQNASFQPGSTLGQQALGTHQSFLPTNNDTDNGVIVKRPRQSDPKGGLFTIRKKRGKTYEEVVVSTCDQPFMNFKYGQHREEVEIEKKHMDPDLSHLPIAPVPNSSITWSWTSEVGVSTFFYPLTCSSSLMAYIDNEESIRQRLLENISYQERIVCKQSLVSRQALTRDYIFSLFVFMNDVVRKSINLNLFHFDTLLSNYVKRETELRQKYNFNENKNEDNDGQSLVPLNRQENITDTHIKDNFCRRQKILVKTFVRYSKWPRNIEAADQTLSDSKSDSRTCSENSNGTRINIEKYENEVTSTVPGNVKTEECNDGVHKKLASDQIRICTKTIEELKEESKFLKSLSTEGNVWKLSDVTLIPVPTDSGSRKSTTCDSRKEICGKKEKYRGILPSLMAQICRKESQQANTASKTALSECVKLPNALSSVGQNDVSTSKVTKSSEKQSNPWIRSEVKHGTSLIQSVPHASVVQSISTSLQPSTVENAKQLSQEPKYVMLGDGSLVPIVQSQKVVQNIASAGKRFVQMPDGTAMPIVDTQVRNDKPPQQLFQLPNGSLVLFSTQPSNLMQNIAGNVQLTNQSLKLSDGTAIPVINQTSNVVKNVGTSVQPTNSILKLPDGSLIQAVSPSRNTIYNGVLSSQAYQSLNVSGTPLVGHLKNLVQSVSKTVTESSNASNVTVMPTHLQNANYVQNISSNNVSQANQYLKMQDGSFVPIINPGQNLTSVLNNHQLLVNSQSAQIRSFNSPLQQVGQNANVSKNTKVEMTSNRNGSLSVQNPLAENPVTQNRTIHLQKSSSDESNKLLGSHENQLTKSKYKSFRDKTVSSLLKRNRSTPTINDNYCSTEDFKSLSANDSNIIIETGLEGPEVEYKRMKQKRKEEAVTRVDPDERRSKKSTIPPLRVPVVEGTVAAETVYNNTVPLNKVKEELNDDFSIVEKGLRIPDTMIRKKTQLFPLLPVKTEPIDF